MKRGLILFLLSSLLVIPLNTYSVAYATESKSATLNIPVSTGLNGTDNSARVFYLDLPSGVSSFAIKTGTFKYSGTNTIIGNITVESGKIRVSLKGNEKTEIISNVQGFNGGFKNPYSTTPGNSIWLYSDGRRWQINDYRADTDTMNSYDMNAEDGKFPSEDPPLRRVTTKSNLRTDGLSWYNNSSKVTVDAGAIIQSTIKPQEYSSEDYSRTPNIKSVNFKDQRLLIDYTIPRASNDRTSYPTKFQPELDDGKHDLSGHAEGRRYQVTSYYYYLADAKVTSYSYAGNVTFDYKLPTEPTLTGTVTLVKPNPNPAKLGNTEMPVQISLKGELQGYSDAANIKEWVFYAKKKDRNDTLQTKKETAKTLAANKSFDFNITLPEVTGETFTQEYALSVVVRFNKKVVTQTGEIDSLEQKLSASAGVYKNTPDVTFPPPSATSPVPIGLPPVAIINAPSEIKAGDDALIDGSMSYDPDGFIKDFWWDTPGAQASIGNTAKGTTWYTQAQVGKKFKILLTTVDNDLQFGSTSTEITVIKPEPEANLRVEGTLKQNRKVILRNNSTSPTRFPLVPEKTYVYITALTGGTNADIKYSGPLGDFETKDVLFKQPGTYRAAIYVENTLGYSASAAITFEIVPDEAPVNYFSLAGAVYRSPENGNRALVAIDDMSYSPDTDVIGRRLWEYRYDSNNDGNFNNEPWVVFSNENKDRLNLEVSEVGKYEVRLTVFEEFGQPTMDEFVTAGDRRSTGSDGQAQAERIVEVKNRAPEVDWSW